MEEYKYLKSNFQTEPPTQIGMTTYHAAQIRCEIKKETYKAPNESCMDIVPVAIKLYPTYIFYFHPQPATVINRPFWESGKNTNSVRSKKKYLEKKWQSHEHDIPLNYSTNTETMFNFREMAAVGKEKGEKKSRIPK